MSVRDYRDEIPASRHGCSYLLIASIKHKDTRTAERTKSLWKRDKVMCPYCESNSDSSAIHLVSSDWDRLLVFTAYWFMVYFNPLMTNDHYSVRTAPLTSKHCILYIYSTNIGTKYFKRCIYSPFFSLQIAVYFIILTYLVPVLFTFYIQDALKFKKIIPAPKG